MRTIPLTRGYEALVDDEDYERLGRWKWIALVTQTGRVYATRSSEAGGRKRTMYLHREVQGATPTVRRGTTA